MKKVGKEMVLEGSKNELRGTAGASLGVKLDVIGGSLGHAIEPKMVAFYNQEIIKEIARFSNRAVEEMVIGSYSWDENAQDVFSIDPDLRKMNTAVEQFIHQISEEFGIVNKDKVALSRAFIMDNVRDKVYLKSLSNLVSTARALVDHPAIQLLVMLDKVKTNNVPYAAMKGIRWQYVKEYEGLAITNEDKYFAEVGKMILKIGTDCFKNTRARGRNSALLEGAYRDFIGYIYDEEVGELLINPVSISTAVSLFVHLSDVALRFKKV